MKPSTQHPSLLYEHHQKIHGRSWIERRAEQGRQKSSEHVAEVTVVRIRLDLKPNDMKCVLTPDLHQ
jgi:hypothetical protein